jgi:hypothetical protein
VARIIAQEEQGVEPAISAECRVLRVHRMGRSAPLHLEPVAVVPRGCHGGVQQRAVQDSLSPTNSQVINLDVERDHSQPLELGPEPGLQVGWQSIYRAGNGCEFLARGVQLVDERDHDAEARLVHFEIL